MRRRNLKKGLGRVQRLEDRRLLAADLSIVELAPIESFEPEMCQVAELETPSDVLEQPEGLDLDTTEVQDPITVDTEVDPIGADSNSDVHDLGDPADGTDGFFGAIDAENPSHTFAFSPTEGGMIDIVVASSFGDSETRLQVTDSSGDVVASTMTEQLSGFQALSFEAEAGESFELTVASEEGAEGYFQVTVEHNEIPEPVDMHADLVGEDSTSLEFVDGASELTGELELASDVDTFRFTADSNGKASLGLAELNAENATELQVQVLNADGEVLTRGITNETVGVSFDVEGGSEYFIAVSAGEGQTGSYQLNIALEMEFAEPEAEVDVDDVVVDDVAVDDVPVDDVAFEDEVVIEGEVAEDPGTDAETNEIDSEDIVSEPVEETGTEIAEEMCDEADLADPAEFVVEAEEAVAVDTDGQIPVEIVEAGDEPTVAAEVDGIAEGFEPEDLAFDSETGDDLDVAVVEDVADIEIPADDVVTEETMPDLQPIDDLIDEEMEICFSDLGSEIDFVDSFFAEFDPASVFTVNDRYELRRMT